MRDPTVGQLGIVSLSPGQQIQAADVSIGDEEPIGDSEETVQSVEGASREGSLPTSSYHSYIAPIHSAQDFESKSPPHLYRPLPELQAWSPSGEPPLAQTESPPSSSPSPSSSLVYGMFSRSKDGTTWNCEECKRVFLSQGSLRAHARIHTGERPYRCRYCHRTFCQASTLKSHERLHTGEKPYKCKHCGRSFTQSAGLRSHMKTHRYDNAPAL